MTALKRNTTIAVNTFFTKQTLFWNMEGAQSVLNVLRALNGTGELNGWPAGFYQDLIFE
jgi:hypothetical protein